MWRSKQRLPDVWPTFEITSTTKSTAARARDNHTLVMICVEFLFDLFYLENSILFDRQERREMIQTGRFFFEFNGWFLVLEMSHRWRW